MRLIIEARLEGGETSETEATTVAVVERKDRSVADLGLTLAEGCALLAEVQSLLVSEQTAGWMDGKPIGLRSLWLDVGTQGCPVNRGANRVWQGRPGTIPE
jgi:hypothetical protein